MLEFLAKYEPIWLFFGIYGEIFLTLGSILFSTFYIAKRLAKRKTYQKKEKENFTELTQGEGK